MLENVTYKSPDLDRRISEMVGRPFDYWTRLRLGGIGSPKLRIIDSSNSVKKLLELDNNLDTCNVEFRPSGIILRFRSLLETYAWVVPFNRLSVARQGNNYVLQDGVHLVRIGSGERSVVNFFRRLLQQANG